MSEISKAKLMFSGSSNPMGLKRILYNQTGSGKSHIAGLQTGAEIYIVPVRRPPC